MNWNKVITTLNLRADNTRFEAQRLSGLRSSDIIGIALRESEYRILRNIADSIENGLKEEKKYTPDVLHAHAQFGGDLDEIQMLYDHNFPITREDGCQLQENDTCTVGSRVYIWVGDKEWIPFTGQRIEKVSVPNTGEINMRVIKDDVPEEEVRNGDIRILGDDVYVRFNDEWKSVGAVVRD